ncbi:MAG: PEP-CTERM sorting domain-containing protein [Sulfuritalea sp.]|nr:PEP-CTERM sorting domain-containing protein [Sulfuritalea sp.]
MDLRGINSVSGEFIQVNVLPAPVPEPASYATMILGLIGVGAAAMTRRRERRTQQN